MENLLQKPKEIAVQEQEKEVTSSEQKPAQSEAVPAQRSTSSSRSSRSASKESVNQSVSQSPQPTQHSTTSSSPETVKQSDSSREHGSEGGVVVPQKHVAQKNNNSVQRDSFDGQGGSSNNNKQEYRSHRGQRSHGGGEGNKHRGQQQSSQGHHSQQKRQGGSMRMMTAPELAELQNAELIFFAKRLGIIGSSLLSKDALIRTIVEYQERPEEEIFVAGILEKLPDGFGFLRFMEYDYTSGPDDVYVSPSFIRKHNLRTGDKIYGSIRKPKEGEKYFALQTVEKVNDRVPEETSGRLNFDRLTPLHPDQRFKLETNPSSLATRIMDIFTPIGKGQRGLIVAPPKVGKTMLLKELALSLLQNYQDVYLIVLLIDERPEEVSDMKRTIKGSNVEIISSTFDESAERHVQVAEIVLEKAKRLVEYGKDVVILLDSLTRLARAYNTTAPTSGKVLTGGIDAHALQRPKRFFGAARKTEEAGSLTIIASAMVETGSRMDEVIYEEFKGTGNMELHLTRKLSNRRTFPAFDISLSSTRRDDLLLSEDELNQAWIFHRLLSTMNVVEGMEFIINKMKQYKTNEELFESLKKSGASASAAAAVSSGSNGNGHHHSNNNNNDNH